jgi:hypothetical protein
MSRLTDRVAFCVVVGLTALVLLATGPAGATTAPEMTTNVRVTLTEGGVVFVPSVHPDTNTTLFVQVVNRARHPRWFQLAGRKTQALPQGGKELFYFSFHLAGVVPWTSGGPGSKVFRGQIQIAVAKHF